jgi:multidrug efflux pump subunit AcrA (membrane-fusion protein)
MTEEKNRTLHETSNLASEIEMHSEEVQEIIGDIPGWLSRWGISSIGLFFTFLLVLSWLIKYPDAVKGKIVITTTPPPINLVARTSGGIRLLKHENDKVREGELIAFLQSAADPEDVLLMERSTGLQTFTAMPAEWKLGELQSYFTRFMRAVQEHETFIKNDLLRAQAAHLEEQRSHYVVLNRNLRAQLQLKSRELNLASERFRRDSILFAEKVTSREDYSRSLAEWLQQKRDYKSTESSIVLNEIQITNILSQISAIKADDVESRTKLALEVENSKKELLASVSAWKEKYLFTSAIDGTVAFVQFIENNKFVEQGSILFSIVPSSKTIYAQMEIPIEGSGKVTKAMDVNIRLVNFPYHEFGMLRGKISEISKVPTKDSYLAKVTLQNGLETSYGRNLTFIEQLQGEAEIITEDRRVLERIFSQMKALMNL